MREMPSIFEFSLWIYPTIIKKNILSLEHEGDSQESLTDEVAIPIKIIIIEFI